MRDIQPEAEVGAGLRASSTSGAPDGDSIERSVKNMSAASCTSTQQAVLRDFKRLRVDGTDCSRRAGCDITLDNFTRELGCFRQLDLPEAQVRLSGSLSCM